MISLEGVTVAYGGFVLLDGISFHISDNDKIGLVGKNGAGKSTILKMICGQQSPTSGRIDMPSDIRIGYLPQIMEHHKGLSVLQETMSVFDENTRIEQEIESITAELGKRSDYESEEYSRLIERLSSGNRKPIRMLFSHQSVQHFCQPSDFDFLLRLSVPQFRIRTVPTMAAAAGNPQGNPVSRPQRCDRPENSVQIQRQFIHSSSRR